MLVILGGVGFVAAVGVGLLVGVEPRRALVLSLVGVGLFAAWNVYLATATFGDDYGVCGECNEYLGNEVPILMPITGFANLVGWFAGLAVAAVVRRLSGRRLESNATTR